MKRSLQLCGRTMVELKRVVQDLLPVELETMTLREALRGRAEQFEGDTGIAVSFRHVGGEVSDPRLATALLRVFQEAMSNVLKHSGAMEVGVVLTVDSDKVTLVVFDDGCGFDQTAATTGTGLAGMKERLALLGGHLEVISSPQTGTRVTARARRHGAE